MLTFNGYVHLAASALSRKFKFFCPRRRCGERQEQSQQGNQVKSLFHAKPTF